MKKISIQMSDEVFTDIRVALTVRVAQAGGGWTDMILAKIVDAIESGKEAVELHYRTTEDS